MNFISFVIMYSQKKWRENMYYSRSIDIMRSLKRWFFFAEQLRKALNFFFLSLSMPLFFIMVTEYTNIPQRNPSNSLEHSLLSDEEKEIKTNLSKIHESHLAKRKTENFTQHNFMHLHLQTYDKNERSTESESDANNLH